MSNLNNNTTELEEILQAVNDLPEAGGGEAIPGEDGATFIPSVSADGVISWTNNKGLDNPESVNIKGPKGDKGKTPEKGTDYWTSADKTGMVNDVLAALPKWTGGSY